MNYKVYQGTELKQTVTSKTAVMNGLQPNRTYEFGVQPDNVQSGADGKTRYTHIAYANMTYVATENSSFTLSERAIVRFGSDDNWIYMAFDAGTYTASNATFGRDPCPNVVKRAEVVSDFSVEQSANKTYVGFCTDLTQGASTNPLDYTWNPIRDGDATRDGTKETISVTTRGIRFNIPKTLTVGSTITLRYEEYPLGIVPIGNEPSGMFGGGNKQNLSAKVISTVNGSSVVEVAGDVIEVGGRNLIHDTSFKQGLWKTAFGNPSFEVTNDGNLKFSITNTSQNGVGTPLEPVEMLKQYTLTAKVRGHGKFMPYIMYNVFPNLSLYNDLGATYPMIDSATEFVEIKYTFTPMDCDVTKQAVFAVLTAETVGNWLEIKKDSLKLEQGSIATPYASFVDGDTFTAQPDGTLALFSEYKALYY